MYSYVWNSEERDLLNMYFGVINIQMILEALKVGKFTKQEGVEGEESLEQFRGTPTCSVPPDHPQPAGEMESLEEVRGPERGVVEAGRRGCGQEKAAIGLVLFAKSPKRNTRNAHWI